MINEKDKESSIFPHAKATYCAIFLTDETTQTQNTTRWGACHTPELWLWHAPQRRQL